MKINYIKLILINSIFISSLTSLFLLPSTNETTNNNYFNNKLIKSTSSNNIKLPVIELSKLFPSISYSNISGRYFSWNNGGYVDADDIKLDKGNSSANVKFTYFINIFEGYKNWLFGSKNEYKYNIKIKLFDANENLTWDNGYEKENQKFLTIFNTRWLAFDNTSYNEIIGNFKNKKSVWGDWTSIDSTTFFQFDKSDNIIIFISSCIAAHDYLWNGELWMRSGVKYNNEGLDLKYQLMMPYSLYDLNQFSAIFNSIMSKPIFITNSPTPIIFDYNDSANEKYVKNIIKDRIKQFCNDPFIKQNLFGNLIINNQLNSQIAAIEPFIEPNIRGKIGSQTISVKLKLKNGRNFCFDGLSPKNELSVNLKVNLGLNPNFEYNIDDLVTIIPYLTASENNHESYKVSHNLNNQSLGSGNNPDPSKINTFNINLNQKDKNGNCLIVDNKLPIISKYGTEISFKLNINVFNKQTNQNILISKLVKFDKLFSNGQIKTDIVFNNADYLNANIRFKNNRFALNLIMNKNNINLSLNQPIDLILNQPANDDFSNYEIKLNISDLSATIPCEQVTSYAKWNQIRASSINNDLEFVGEYETFDPFIFKLQATPIKLIDPITGQNLGYASKYKPFIRQGKYNPNNQNNNNSNNKDQNFFSSPKIDPNETSYYECNLGSYAMQNKTTNGEFEFQIVIKEFDQNSKATNENDRYTKDKWIISIKMKLLNDQATFKMLGYDNNNEIEKTNKEKFFNKESPYFRGDFVDEKTGMYKPKIVWVNAFPPESFLYDPLDENGQKIVQGANSQQEEIEKSKRANYDIGYIAQLNANGFSNGDYSSLPTFGGYSTIFNEQDFKPNGLLPYSESYTFTKNNLIPAIEHTPLSRSGLETIISLGDFKQVVLKRTQSSNYLYQFIKIAPDSKTIDQNHNLIDLYNKNLKGLKDKPLFVDFFDTYQGKHLIDYLTIKNHLIENEQKVRELSYSEIMQYWNIYVNDPSHYNQNYENNEQENKYNINQLQNELTTPIIISVAELAELRNIVINQIQDKLTTLLINNGWINSNTQLINDLHFHIENSNDIFEKKLAELLKNYSLDLLEAKEVSFNITMNEEAFKNEVIKPTGTINIKFFNNKNSNDIIDLSKYQASVLSLNTNLEPFKSSNHLVSDIKSIIYESINRDLVKIINQSAFKGYEPKLNQDYKLKFYTKFYNQQTNQVKYFNNLDEVIKQVLLFDNDKNVFYNTFYIEIEAIFDNNHRYLINSFNKQIINNSNQKQPIVEFSSFDLSKIKASDIKVNTNASDFPNTKPKHEVIYDLILERVKRDIYFYARNWLDIFNLDLEYETDYDIKFIKTFNQNTPVFYETNTKQEILELIKQLLVDSVNQQQVFNVDLNFMIIATSNKLTGSFIKTINNSNKNKAIEPPIDIPIDSSDQENNSFSGANQINDLNNLNSNDPGFDWWWVVTPLTIFSVAIICLVIFYLIRKNRKIR